MKKELQTSPGKRYRVFKTMEMTWNSVHTEVTIIGEPEYF